MIYHYRCSIKRRCGKRITLAQPIDWYRIRPKCPGCKKDTLKPDNNRGLDNKKATCRCRGIRWPHRKGTYLNKNEFCEHAKVDLYFEGSRITEMKPKDDCPF